MQERESAHVHACARVSARRKFVGGHVMEGRTLVFHGGGQRCLRRCFGWDGRNTFSARNCIVPQLSEYIVARGSLTTRARFELKTYPFGQPSALRPRAVVARRGAASQSASGLGPISAHIIHGIASRVTADILALWCRPRSAKLTWVIAPAIVLLLIPLLGK